MPASGVALCFASLRWVSVRYPCARVTASPCAKSKLFYERCVLVYFLNTQQNYSSLSKTIICEAPPARIRFSFFRHDHAQLLRPLYS
jgi:hypothetical protein